MTQSIWQKKDPKQQPQNLNRHAILLLNQLLAWSPMKIKIKERIHKIGGFF
jgi:hypothetical protein